MHHLQHAHPNMNISFDIYFYVHCAIDIEELWKSHIAASLTYYQYKPSGVEIWDFHWHRILYGSFWYLRHAFMALGQSNFSSLQHRGAIIDFRGNNYSYAHTS